MKRFDIQKYLKIFKIIQFYSILFIGWVGHAQEVNRPMVMGIKEDVSALQQQVGSLSLEIEALKTVCDDLKAQLLQLHNQSQIAINPQLIDSQMQSLQSRFDLALNEAKQDILKQLSKKIDQLMITPVAKAAPEKITFSEDYPKSGIVYTVQPGDTLSKIAQEQQSSVKDIQNANKISDPKSLKVGQELFIPQK